MRKDDWGSWSRRHDQAFVDFVIIHGACQVEDWYARANSMIRCLFIQALSNLNGFEQYITGKLACRVSRIKVAFTDSIIELVSEEWHYCFVEAVVVLQEGNWIQWEDQVYVRFRCQVVGNDKIKDILLHLINFPWNVDVVNLELITTRRSYLWGQLWWWRTVACRWEFFRWWVQMLISVILCVMSAINCILSGFFVEGNWVDQMAHFTWSRACNCRKCTTNGFFMKYVDFIFFYV